VPNSSLQLHVLKRAIQILGPATLASRLRTSEHTLLAWAEDKAAMPMPDFLALVDIMIEVDRPPEDEG